MSKETINVKSNGLRNELKEIRKSIDTLTYALHILIETQTNKQHENDNFKPYWEHHLDRMRYTTSDTSTTTSTSSDLQGDDKKRMQG